MDCPTCGQPNPDNAVYCGECAASPSARNAARCAIAIQQALAAHAAEHPEQPIRVRIGAHTGEALKDADRFFGKTVIQAYRKDAPAEPNTNKVSAAAEGLVDNGTGGGRCGARPSHDGIRSRAYTSA